MIDEIQSIVRRSVEIHDITLDIAELLVRRWTASGLERRRVLRRVQWFADTNRTAVALGVAKPIDFSTIDTNRKYDTSANRMMAPVPTVNPAADAGNAAGLMMSLLVFLETVYMPMRLVGCSHNTIRLYRCSINAYSRWLGRVALVADLNTESVSAFLSDLLSQTKLSRHTIQKDRTQLVVLWNFAAKLGVLKEFPQIASIPCPDRVPDSWTVDELRRLIEAIQRRTDHVGKVPASLFWLALVNVVYDTAERIGAVLSLQWEDIDTDGWVTIKGEHRKGKTRDIKRKLRQQTIELIHRNARV